MKSQINLYHKEFRPRFEVFAAANLLLLCLVCLLVCGSVFAIAEFSRQQAQKSLEVVKKSQGRAEQEIAELTQALAQRSGDPVLQSQFDKIKLELATQRQLVAQIQSLSRLRDKSFSSMFDAFSSNHKANLWLTAFTVNESDLSIIGEFSSPKALPAWISDLNQTSYFSGQEFNEAIVERSEDSLQFKLTSQVADFVPTVEARGG